ncbi:hypothetical protein ABZT43_09410 [Streptomyces sp. NPDC005349]|uniref:hypothetical protein n=1 Tax=Streptomyces sp. NPDC005349 TaxID=3157037 RepID=UPI0033B5EADC
MLEADRRQILTDLRKQLRTVMDGFDSLPFPEDVERLEVRNRAIVSCVRFLYYDAASAIIFRASAVLALFLMLSVGYVLLFLSFPVWQAAQGGVVYTVAIPAFFILLAKSDKYVKRLEFRTERIWFVFGMVIVAVSATVYLAQGAYTKGEGLWVAAASFSAGFAAGSIWLILGFMYGGALEYFMKEERGVKRYDAALFKWIQAAFAVHQSRGRIHRYDVLRTSFVLIEEAARRVEAIGYSTRVSSLLEAHHKIILRDESRRMAEVLRNHKRALVQASRREDFDAVVASMVAGVIALAAGDREALLENAPERVSRSEKIRRVAVWVLPALTLISAGIVLPMVPSVAAQGAAASSLRWSLIVAGVLSIVAAQKDVAARINDTFGKAMTWK